MFRPVYESKRAMLERKRCTYVTPSPTQMGRGVRQPCSMSCGRGAVPSLACAACLCLYHPACLGLTHAPPHPFFCKNCDSSSPRDPPSLVHKSGVTTASGLQAPVPVPASVHQSGDSVPVPRLVPAPKTQKNDKRVLLRMKMSGGADGQKVWAVSPSATSVPTQSGPVPSAPPTLAAPQTPNASSAALQRHALPQSLAVINGRREKVTRRVTNGASPPPAALPSPRRRGRTKADDAAHFSNFHASAREKNYNVALQIFQYVGMRDLARCARVCKLWQTLTDTPALWRHVRMKNSHVSDWGGLCAVLKKRSTKWLDLRKMLLPSNDTVFWDQFIESIGTVDTLERLELCRCPARVVEAVCRRVSSLRALCAPAICDTVFDPEPLAELPRLELLRLKSLKGLSLTRNLQPLSALSNLQHLSLTSIKELGWCACEVVGELEQLESLELGECSFGSPFAAALSKLVRLRRLRLERGVPHCAASALLKALASLPKLTRLELVNFDVKVGFDDALAECKNIQRLLIIPTYVSQSATTNKQVLSGVLRLKDTLTHLMWGVTIELLRVTELFIDQCEAGGEVEAPEGQGARRELGECIPVLKPVPGCRLPDDLRHVAGPPQVEILPIPTLQRLLSAQLPNTKLKLLRIPFHATWRQTLADFQ
ncbi:unnamed protein product [Pieris macdunnoughi]|uniref:F-box domain-containing protein n=1 Tax=Pieris macdunnoughi TaxID=345717 RepID=A0A821SPM5_9NEOP|nr:unnamed protein product [Pieris macdunnoughi]